MGNIVFNVNTRVAFYFKNHTRNQVNQLIQQHGSITAAADSVQPDPVPVQLVVDIITNANNIQPPVVNNFNVSGNPVLEFDFSGFNLTYGDLRHTIPINIHDIQTSFLSTDVIFRDNQVPVEDENINNISRVPKKESDVVSLANDE